MAQAAEGSRSGSAGASPRRSAEPARASDDASRLERLRAWTASRHIWVHENADIRVVGSGLASGAAQPQEAPSQGAGPATEATAAEGAGFGVFARAQNGDEGSAIGLRQVGAHSTGLLCLLR